MRDLNRGIWLDCFVCLIIIFYFNPAKSDPHRKGVVSSINIGARYSSILESKGVVLYRDFQIDPVVGIFLFDDRLEFLGDSIGYRDFVYSDVVRLRTRIVSITDEPLFPNYQSVKSGSPNRPDTYEWNSRLELFLPGYNGKYLAELDLGYSKDVSVSHGSYFELQSKIKIFDFRILPEQTLIESNIFASLGWGDSLYNQYYYGPSADSSGFNNLSYGFWFAFPKEADRYYPIIQLTHFEVLGDYKKGEFTKGRDSGLLFSFIATVGILD